MFGGIKFSTTGKNPFTILQEAIMSKYTYRKKSAYGKFGRVSVKMAFKHDY